MATPYNYEDLIKKYAPEWQKGQILTKTATMTDEDYENALNYYNAYNSQEKAQTLYDQSYNKIENERNKQLQQADVLNQKLQKYLPEHLRNTGFGGSKSMTESAYIQAKNEHLSNIGDIESDADNRQMDLLNNYNQTTNDIYDSSQEKAQDIYGYYKTQRDNISQGHFEAGATLLKNGNFKSVDEINNLLNNYKSLVNEEQYNTLESLAQSAVNIFNTNQQTTIYNDAVTLLESGGFNSTEEIDNFLNGYNGRISPDQFDTLSKLANKVKNDFITNQQNAYFADAESLIKNSTFNNLEEIDNFVAGYKGKISDSDYEKLVKMGETAKANWKSSFGYYDKINTMIGNTYDLNGINNLENYIEQYKDYLSDSELKSLNNSLNDLKMQDDIQDQYYEQVLLGLEDLKKNAEYSSDGLMLSSSKEKLINYVDENKYLFKESYQKKLQEYLDAIETYKITGPKHNRDASNNNSNSVINKLIPDTNSGRNYFI